MSDVLSFGEIDSAQVGLVGGKGAQLAELARIDGVHVPDGFCVATSAFQRVLALAPSIHHGVDRLTSVHADDRETIRKLSAELRVAIAAVAVPDDVASAITRAYGHLGDEAVCAVRSSATTEDSPTASSAGQHDTHLNIVGAAAIIEHVSRCWASLFTERAVTYRIRNGVDHRRAQMAVVVQRMIPAKAAGIVFTADPVTSNRTIASVEASFGLGEALVSGLVNPDTYKVRDGEILERATGTKRLAIVPAPDGGTRQQTVEPSRREQPALTDAQVVQLTQSARRIEAHFGRPQDIEWCLDDAGFHFVQSRPITTLFPVPEIDDDDHHVYVSVGHQQMMTDPITPLGLSVWRLTALRPMFDAGSRLFVDVTDALASPTLRAGLLDALGRSDPLIRDALQVVVDRGDFVPTRPDAEAAGPPPSAPSLAPSPIDTDPAIVDALIDRWEASTAAAHRDIEASSGSELFDVILTDIQELQRLMVNPQSQQVLMAAFEATWWLNEHLDEWLGETNAADVLTRSAPHNVTSEMGLALLDVADVIRPHADVVSFLERIDNGDDGADRADGEFLGAMAGLDGGEEARDAIVGFLDRYGMRGAGEIDIARPRWSERPDALVPVLLGHITNVEPGEATRRFERGRREAAEKAHEVIDRLRTLPDGAVKAADAERMIDRLRTFIGYREYPKYAMVSRYLVYKRMLWREADRLVAAGVLSDRDDIAFLTFAELRDVVHTNHVDRELIDQRKESFQSSRALTPPRVLTSDGEVIAGSYRRDGVPGDALIGLAVSSGTVEGRARVVLDMADADLEPGDILVTTHTDPSWSPLFVAIAGLVTEVGGLMTHGAVITREYGIPAVVGVEDATRSIRDGQRIRVHGTDGYVEILDA